MDMVVVPICSPAVGQELGCVATTSSDSYKDIFQEPWPVSKQSPIPNWSGKLQANAGAHHVSCQVEYQCGGFVEKNRDAVPEELVGLLRASKVRATLSRGCVGQSTAGLWPQELGAGEEWWCRRCEPWRVNPCLPAGTAPCSAGDGQGAPRRGCFLPHSPALAFPIWRDTLAMPCWGGWRLLLLPGP